MYFFIIFLSLKLTWPTIITLFFYRRTLSFIVICKYIEMFLRHTSYLINISETLLCRSSNLMKHIRNVFLSSVFKIYIKIISKIILYRLGPSLVLGRISLRIFQLFLISHINLVSFYFYDSWSIYLTRILERPAIFSVIISIIQYINYLFNNISRKEGICNIIKITLFDIEIIKHIT